MANVNQGILGTIKVKGYARKDGTKVREHQRHLTFADVKDEPNIPEEIKQRIYDEDQLTKVKAGETVKYVGSDWEVESVEPSYLEEPSPGKLFYYPTKVNLKQPLRNFVGRKTVFLRDLDINYKGETKTI